jgi:hypothetical protein
MRESAHYGWVDRASVTELAGKQQASINSRRTRGGSWMTRVKLPKKYALLKEFYMNFPTLFARAAIAGSVGIVAQGCTTSSQEKSIDRMYVREVYVTGSAVRHDVDPRTGEVDTPDRIYILTPREFGDSQLYRDLRDGSVLEQLRPGR